jgi:hypothetical protein
VILTSGSMRDLATKVHGIRRAGESPAMWNSSGDRAHLRWHSGAIPVLHGSGSRTKGSVWFRTSRRSLWRVFAEARVERGGITMAAQSFAAAEQGGHDGARV